MLRAAGLHIGSLIFKSGPLIGIGLLFSLLLTVFQWQGRPEIRFLNPPDPVLLRRADPPAAGSDILHCPAFTHPVHLIRRSVLASSRPPPGCRGWAGGSGSNLMGGGYCTLIPRLQSKWIPVVGRTCHCWQVIGRLPQHHPHSSWMASSRLLNG